MTALDWKPELVALLHRHPETGLQHDIDGMSEAEQYAAFTWLRRYAEGHA